MKKWVRALDLASGKEIWRAAYPVPYTVNPAARTHSSGPKSTPAIAGGREGEQASMLGSHPWLLASTTDGHLVVARPNTETYEQVRRYQIAPSALWAHPAIAGTSIIAKDVDTLICWSVAP